MAGPVIRRRLPREQTAKVGPPGTNGSEADTFPQLFAQNATEEKRSQVLSSWLETLRPSQAAVPIVNTTRNLWKNPCQRLVLTRLPESGQPDTVRTFCLTIGRLASRDRGVNVRRCVTVNQILKWFESSTLPRGGRYPNRGFVEVGAFRINNLRRSPKVELHC